MAMICFKEGKMVITCTLSPCQMRLYTTPRSSCALSCIANNPGNEQIRSMKAIQAAMTYNHSVCVPLFVVPENSTTSFSDLLSCVEITREGKGMNYTTEYSLCSRHNESIKKTLSLPLFFPYHSIHMWISFNSPVYPIPKSYYHTMKSSYIHNRNREMVGGQRDAVLANVAF